MRKPYDPNVHYNHCIMCGRPIETQEERDQWCDEDGNPYHNYCAKEQGVLDEIWEEREQEE